MGIRVHFLCIDYVGLKVHHARALHPLLLIQLVLQFQHNWGFITYHWNFKSTGKSNPIQNSMPWYFPWVLIFNFKQTKIISSLFLITNAKSIIILRLTIIIMIIVNYGGGGIYCLKYFVWILNNNFNFLPGYWFFEHSPWNGITIADVIFPWYWTNSIFDSLTLYNVLTLICFSFLLQFCLDIGCQLCSVSQFPAPTCS